MTLPSQGAICLLIFCALLNQPQTLREVADKDGILVSAAVRPTLLSEAAYAATLAREFNMLEPEDALKWAALRPDEITYNFHDGDAIVHFANEHRMKVRGHCLIWGRSNPDWLAQGHFTPERLSQLMHDHITRVMQHYVGQVYAWDVLNESLDENGKLRDSIWYNQPGIGLAAERTAYIEQAFRWAHEADAKALLFYNENEGEALNRKSDSIYSMLKDFKQRGVPIDGIGLQMHVPLLDPDFSGIAANIARLAALGLQVQITELDVSLPIDANGSVHPEDLTRQAEVYRGIVHACLSNPGCTAIQTWGITDKYSWIGSHSKGTRGQALLFDRMYRPKSAYTAVLQELSAGRTNVH